MKEIRKKKDLIGTKLAPSDLIIASKCTHFFVGHRM